MPEEVKEKVGLERLGDEALAAIVDRAIGEYGGDVKRWHHTAIIAFEEHARRSGHDV